MGSYVDPGAIIALITGLIASLVALPMYFLIYKNKLKGWLNERRNKKHNRHDV